MRSQFADNLAMKIRNHYKMPHSYPVKFNENFEFVCDKSNESKMGRFLVNLVYNYDDVFNWISDVAILRTIRYKIRNYRNKTHCLRVPGAKRGEWCDYTHRVPEALFAAVIDFVETECSVMMCMCNDIDTKRIKHDKEFAIHKGIEWIKFQASSEFCTPEQASERLELIEIYRYAKYVRVHYEKELDIPYDELWYETYTKIEKRQKATEEHYLCRIIALRDFLWT